LLSRQARRGAGTYTDNVVVEKPDLTLRGQGVVRLVAAGGVEGVRIEADGVTVQNLDVSSQPLGVQFNTCGVRVNKGNGPDLRNLRVHDNGAGICLFSPGTGHRVRNNVIENNRSQAIFGAPPA